MIEPSSKRQPEVLQGLGHSQHPRKLFLRAPAKYVAGARLPMHTICCQQNAGVKMCCGRNQFLPICTFVSSERLHSKLQALGDSHR